MNILVLDDEKEIADLVEVYLKNENYNVFKFYDSKEALKCIENQKLDFAILDVMIKDVDGFEICKMIRDKGLNFPVIMLTAKIEDKDKIQGLTLGADDYIVKPFEIDELLARVEAVIRRCHKKVNIADIEINLESRNVKKGGKEVKLTPTEYNILKFLTKNKGKVFSIEDIYTNVWDGECYAAENVIAVHIRHIREKIEINPKEPKYLKVIWGIGYKVEAL